MAGLGSAALAAAKLFGGIQKGKLAGSQRAREEATQRAEAEDAEQRARLDEMVKMSTVGRNKAETAEQLRATSAAPKTFAEFLAREAAGRNPPAPRNIDPLSEPGIAANSRRAEAEARIRAKYPGAKEPKEDRRFEDFTEKRLEHYMAARTSPTGRAMPDSGLDRESAWDKSVADAQTMGYAVPKAWLQAAKEDPEYAEHLRSAGIDPTTGKRIKPTQHLHER